MGIFTYLRNLSPLKLSFAIILLCMQSALLMAQTTTRWKGTGTKWDDPTNWTAGAPDATKHVVIGDASFTGNKQPTIEQNYLAECLSLTVGGVNTSKLLVTSDKGLTVHGDVVIAANSELENEGSYLTIKGSWTNNGTYTEKIFVQGQSANARSTQDPKVEFSGTSKSIGGIGFNSFNTLIIRGSINLTSGISMVARSNTSGNRTTQPSLQVYGTLDPGSSLVTMPSIAGDNTTFQIGDAATVMVKAPTYFNNYTIKPTSMVVTGIIDYAGGNQVIESSIMYAVLRVSGSGTKTLNGNTSVFNSQETKLIIDAGVLDLGTNTLDRISSPGGTLSIASGATLRIGGTNTFPANYGTNTLHANSTVEYYGSNQTVALQTYGHLHLSGSGTKTMPATAMTVAGNLISSGTASFTAGAAINVTGNVAIGTGSTFNGGSATHTVGGNWTADGTFTGNASTVTMTGTNKTIGGTANSPEFFNLTVNGTGTYVTFPSLIIRGNLSATGGISQVADGTIAFTNTVSKSISGNSLNFQNLTIDGIVTTASSMTLNGNFTTNAGKNFTASAGTVSMAGAGKSIAGPGSMSFFGLNIANTTSTASSFTITSAMSGTSALTASAGTATFASASTFANTHYLNDVAITGTSLRLMANSNLHIAGAFTKGGTSAFDISTATPNTVHYNGTAAQTILPVSYHNLVLANSGIKTAGGAVTVNGDITISAGATLNAGAYNHTLNGNFINSGVFNHDNGTITFAGAADKSITGATVFNNLALSKTSMSNSITLNNSVTASMLQMTSGTIQTGANKVNILNNRSGNGWVIGTVTRSHTFNDGIAYAFNAPYSQLTFATPSGINEASMTVTSESITDFTNLGAINRKYAVAIPAGTYTNGTLQLQYYDADLNGNNEAGLQLYRYNTGVARWLTQGRTSANATDNWVSRSALTSMDGSWTMSASPNTYRWVGGTSTAWELADNWLNTTDGYVSSAVVAPLSNDIANLGEVVPTNHPVINSAVTISGLKYKGAGQTNLNIATGSLTVTGNLEATGAGSAILHSLNVNNNPLSVGGNLVLNDGSAGNSIALSSGSGNITVAGALQHRGSSSVALSNGILAIGGDYTYEAGAPFTAGSSTVMYNGTGSQVVATVPYHHLTINKPGGMATYTSAAAQSITGNLTINNNGFLNLNVPTFNVAGNVSISAGRLQANATTTIIDLKGNWSTANISSFTAGASTVVFSGSADQTVSATTFNNLSKTTGNTLTTTGSSTLTGNLSVQGGTLVLNGHTMNRNAAGGTLTLANGATLRINNAAIYPANFGTNTLGLNSTVIYSGGSIAIAPVVYGYLTVQDGSTRALQADTRVANLITVTNATLNSAAVTLTLDNDLLNNGTINAPATSINFTSASAKIDGTGTTVMNDLTVAGGAGLIVNKNIALHGNLVNNGTSFSAPANQVEFTGTNAASITSASPVSINQLRISKAAAATTVTLAADINEMQSIDVAAGTLDAATRALTKKAVSGTTLAVADGATMKVGGTNSLPVFDAYTLTPASTIVYNGINQSIKSIQYGHLDLLNTGTATFEVGTASIAGNLTKATTATVITPAVINYNGAATQVVAALDYNTLTLSSTGAKTFAAGDTRIAEALTKPGTAPVDARTNITTVHYTKAGDQSVFPLNYHNLNLSGSGTKTFSGITGIANSFTITDAATADLITSESTIDFNGAGAQVIPALNYSKILLSAGGDKALAGNTDVTNELRLTSGKINTGGYKVTLGNAATIIESEGNYVTGIVETTRSLPAGVTETFGNIGINIQPDPAGAPIGLTKVTRVTGTTVGTTGKSILRSFKVEPDSPGSELNATVGIFYLNHELNGLSNGSLSLYQSDAAGNKWTALPAASTTNLAPAVNKVSVSGISSLTSFTLGDRNIPLPIELLSFKAVKSGSDVVLRWETAMEKDNEGFDVEVSADGYSYRKLGFVQSKTTNSVVKQEYTFTDTENGKNGTRYYRLRQRDLDGTVKVYGPKTVSFGQVFSTTIKAYPNPFHNRLELAIDAAATGQAIISLRDAVGKTIYKNEVTVEAGISVLPVTIGEGYQQGLYILTIELNNQTYQHKLIRQ
ncbi:T9SS type A sorting domain-containing protein [Pontibacter vulgaris]|uniref:T9SS type A sorting domain-containing protein n=1 Tax=Pontibacter vulgaris TaxID=2905679 RepID=UPI001FA7BFC5|nr:T9SS type A sorting domain-containing protein [Pontibacter vulgaris]